MAFDFADLGNTALGIATSISGYLAATGKTAEGVLALAIGGIFKSLFSAIDNYKFKKTQ